MRLEPFRLERYFAPKEFAARYMLSGSDCSGHGNEHVYNHPAATTPGHMTGRTKIDRPIAPEEAAVIFTALERAAVAPEFALLRFELQHLRAVERCSCGCDSVDFVEHDRAQGVRPIADAIGTTPAGGTVGVIVWGTADAVAGLETYDLGAGEGEVKLPVPDSIEPFPRGPA